VLLFNGAPDIEVVDQAEQNSDSEEYPQNSVPWRQLPARHPAEEYNDEVCEADFKRQGVHQGRQGAHEYGSGVRHPAKMK